MDYFIMAISACLLSVGGWMTYKHLDTLKMFKGLGGAFIGILLFCYVISPR